MPEQIPLMVDAVTQELRQFTSDETIPRGQLLAALQVALTGLVTSNTSGVLASDTILQALGKLQAQASNKVDKVAGKQLSTEDFTSAEKTKLGGIAAGAQVNAVTSVAGRTGAVVLAKADVGLGSVDDTADSAKPVSTAQQTALNLKANLASPALTGTPTAPTAATATNTTQLATTAFVQAVNSADTGSSATALTLKTARTINGTSFNGSANITTANWGTARNITIGSTAKAVDGSVDVSWTVAEIGAEPLLLAGTTSQYYRGDKTWQTLNKAAVGLSNVDNTADSAKPVSTAQQTALNLKANLASPALTGTPTAPTASDGTSTTQLATTAFVQGAVGGFLSKTTTGGTTTLTTAEASNPIIKVSGALTSNAILEIPVASKRNYSIENATTGAFTLTVKHVGLTPSVLVAQGKRNIVMTNGVGAYDAINDFESIALTGTPTAPTAGSTTNTTQVATTAFVQAVNTADTGSSATALKLKTARTIGGVSFDGSANINLPGVNTAGNQATTGNAGTATKLQTARTIGGVSFDGSANINLPGVNTAGNQATTGNAGTATKLQTARTINGVAFDGSVNITIPTPDVDFTIIYPNGGTEAAPANITNNQRLVSANPFSGKSVICEVQILIGGVWADPGWASNTGAEVFGVCAGQVNQTGDIAVQSGVKMVAGTSSITGGLHGWAGTLTTAPVRVKVWKVG